MAEIVNSATINADLGALAVLETSTVTVQLEDVWFNKKADKDTWQDGPLTYTIEVRNDGDPDEVPTPASLTNIVITDAIDIANLALDTGSFVFTPAGSGSMTYVAATGALEITLNDVPPGQLVTVSFQVERIFS